MNQILNSFFQNWRNTIIILLSCFCCLVLTLIIENKDFNILLFIMYAIGFFIISISCILHFTTKNYPKNIFSLFFLGILIFGFIIYYITFFFRAQSDEDTYNLILLILKIFE